MIYVIGDSHTSVFSGLNKIQPIYPELKNNDSIKFFKTFRINTETAYNSYYKAIQITDEIINRYSINQQDYIIFSYGEVDCRKYLLRQYEIKKDNDTRDMSLILNEVVQDCVNRLIKTLLYYKNQGINVIAYGPVPTFKDIYTKYLPINTWYGDEKSRNKVTLLFNKFYENKCKEYYIPYITLYYDLTNNYDTIDGYHLNDKIHMNQKVMYLLIKKLYLINVINKVDFYKYNVDKFIKLSNKPKNYDWHTGDGFLFPWGTRNTIFRPNGMDKSISKDNLLILKKIFDDNNLRFHLIDGTLLGAIRDKDFITGDSDTDIRINFEDIPLLVHITPILINNGLIPLRVSNNEISFFKNNEYIDIEFQHKITRFTKKLEKIKFLGTEFYIPSDHDEYLTICYGNWRVKSDKHTWIVPT